MRTSILKESHLPVCHGADGVYLNVNNWLYIIFCSDIAASAKTHHCMRMSASMIGFENVHACVYDAAYMVYAQDFYCIETISHSLKAPLIINS